jgi:sialate O-acetylesterase
MYFSYREEFELPANQNIRIITVPITYAFDGEKDSVENPQWNCACPEHLANMAGTSYFFAKKLQSDLGVPVGIINPAQGGSPINSWVNKEVLEKMNQEEFLARLKIYEDPKNIEDKKASVAKAQGEWAQTILDSDLGFKENWQEIPFSSINNDWSSCTIPGFIDELDSAGIV